MTPLRSSTPFNHLYDIYSCGTSILCTDFIPHCTAAVSPCKATTTVTLPRPLWSSISSQAQGNSFVFSPAQIKVFKCSRLLDFCGQGQTAPCTSKPTVTPDYPQSKQRGAFLPPSLMVPMLRGSEVITEGKRGSCLEPRAA